METKFKCRKCGKCCMIVGFFFEELNRGDGNCQFFDKKKKLCTIYETRPKMCRVDEMYEVYKNVFPSKESYYNFQKSICNKVNEV